MLRILEAQMEQLGQRSARQFVARMAGYLREAFPAETEPFTVEALAAWVERNVERAAGFGVDTEPEVAQLLLLSLHFGEDASERLAWFRAPLLRAELIGAGKVRALVRAARDASDPGIERFVTETFAT